MNTKQTNHTFADQVNHPGRKDKDAFFMEELESWRKVIPLFLERELGIGSKIVRSVPIVPTGYFGSNRELPNCTDWLGKLLVACFKVAESKGAFNLLIINEPRLPVRSLGKPDPLLGGSDEPKNPSSDNRQIATLFVEDGGTGEPKQGHQQPKIPPFGGSDGAKMPPSDHGGTGNSKPQGQRGPKITIDKDDEDTIVKRTWEIIKALVKGEIDFLPGVFDALKSLFFG